MVVENRIRKGNWDRVLRAGILIFMRDSKSGESIFPERRPINEGENQSMPSVRQCREV